MADEAKTDDAAFTDDIWSAAAGYRKTATWISGALGAIPGLSIIAAIVRAPGENGWEGWQLAVGIVLAAAGGLLAVYAFANVMRPVALEDSQLGNFAMVRVPGNPHSTFQVLLTTIADLRATVATKEGEAADVEDASTRAKAEVASKDFTVKRLKAELEGTEDNDQPTKNRLSREIAAAETELARANATAEMRAAEATNEMRALKEWTAQLSRHSKVKRQVYQVAAADKVADRFNGTVPYTIGAVALIGLGVFFLGIAPIEKKPEAAPTPALVALELNAVGQNALGCEDDTLLQAIRVGGDDAMPEVITLPTPTCPAKSVKFRTDEKASYGKVTAIEALPAD